MKEERSKFRVNSKNAVSVLNIDYLKRHRGSAVNGILCSTGWTKPTVTTKRNKFKCATGRTTIHDATKRRVATVNHAVNIFDDGGTRM